MPETLQLKQAVLRHAMRIVSSWQGHPHQAPGKPQSAAGQPDTLSPSVHALNSASPVASHSQSVTQLYHAADTSSGAQLPGSSAACEACDRVEQLAESIFQQVS